VWVHHEQFLYKRESVGAKQSRKLQTRIMQGWTNEQDMVFILDSARLAQIALAVINHYTRPPAGLNR
jgi:hypothetical protein